MRLATNQSASPTKRNSREFTKNLLVLLGLCINCTCAFTAAIFLRLDFFSFLALVFFFSFLVGILVPDLNRSLIVTFLSVLAGAAITVGLYLSPPLLAGKAFLIDFVIEEILSAIAPFFLFGIVCAFLGTMVGSLLSGAIRS